VSVYNTNKDNKDKENQKENAPNQNMIQPKEFKKINHYKNTRVNYNNTAILKKWRLKDFNISKKLGKGRFGEVFLV